MGFRWKMKPLKFRSVHPVPIQAEESGQLGLSPARGGHHAADGCMSCDTPLLYKTLANRNWRKMGHCLVLLAIKLKSWAEHHRTAWIGRDLKGHFIPNPLPREGASSTGSGFWFTDTVPSIVRGS